MKLIFKLGIFYVIFIFMAQAVSSQNRNRSDERLLMVANQLEARGIHDKKVLAAFREVPRHEFVLPEYLDYAYTDRPLPIEEGQTISQPYVVAFMTEALDLQQTDRVLEVGTGSGYQAAILAQLCDSVYTIEIFETLTLKAQKAFKKLDYATIHCKIGDGYEGWQEKAPFDAIIVTCSPSHIPVPLQEQLAEGGRLIIPVHENRVQHLVLLQKKNGKIRQRNVLPVRFVPMIDEDGKTY
ncbi:protein-L-isoaspartate(D-aspartate) O-methyltransferase [uncultured Draconibacterium sp.]|uniref:protein-L-isoaspartate(D-aspartate) O-methyltransferase n=1 Tax=uncultured Draconibacterium sp. TaxID=1573823 RepID=UPI00321724BF